VGEHGAHAHFGLGLIVVDLHAAVLEPGGVVEGECFGLAGGPVPEPEILHRIEHADHHDGDDDGPPGSGDNP
jgi:hypothetical protein